MAIQALRNRDKMKDDAITQLSDQVLALRAIMQEFELENYNKNKYVSIYTINN